MAIDPYTFRHVLPKLVGPIWAVDNPEYYAERSDPRCMSGPNAELLLQRKIERMEEEKRNQPQPEPQECTIPVYEVVEYDDEISSDDSQDQISIEQYDSDDQESFTKDRFRGTGAGTVLELSSTTISQFLKPFKSQLADLSHLVEFTELAPYITTPTSVQPSSRDSHSTNSSNNGEEDDSPPAEKRRRLDRSAKVQYPPTEAQNKTLNQFRAAHTLVFTSLPSADWIIKLIAISVQISEPFFGKVLFPNVKNVVFSSAMQEKSLVDRYAHLGSFPLPHPLTFALDWLVYDFSLCIHSTTLAFRTQWINSQVKSDKSNGSLEAKVERYERKWRDLNPLAGTASIEKLHQLRSIAYHNILPGDRPQSSGKVETYLYFGRHDTSNEKAIEITLRSISRPVSQAFSDPQVQFPAALHTIDIEYLAFPTPTKPGPKTMAQQEMNRGTTLRRLFVHVVTVYEVDGRRLEKMVGRRLWAMIQDGANEQRHDRFCQTCRELCDEVSCNPY